MGGYPGSADGQCRARPSLFLADALLDELVWQLCGRCAQSASCVWLACPALRRLVRARTICIASDHLDGCGAICGDAAACAVCPRGSPLQPVDGVHFGVGGAVAAGCAVNTSTSWLLYALSLAVGLYTQLLFVLVAIAHALYIALTVPLWVKGQLGAIARSYLLAAGAALLSFVPWLLLLVHNLDRVEDATDALKSFTSFTELIKRWVLGISRSFVGEDLGSANSVLMLLAIYALYVLWRTAETRIWLFVVLLVAVPFLALALPDLVLGGARTLRIRYLIPSYIGLQLALAYWFGTQAVQVRTWGQKACRVGLVALLTEPSEKPLASDMGRDRSGC